MDRRKRIAEQWDVTAPTNGEKKTHWALVEVRNLVNPALAAIASVLVTVWVGHGVSSLLTWPALIYASIALATIAVWALCYFWLLRPRYSELAQQLETTKLELNGAQRALQDTLDTALTHLLVDLKLNTPECRVSAYSVEGEQFVLLSRQSSNPRHEKRGRATYALDKGVIGQAWARDSAFRVYSAQTRAEWDREMASTGDFTIDEARALTMFARSILAIRVDQAQTEKVGMLVFESTEPDAFDATSAGKMRRRGLHAAIADVIAWHDHFPRAKDWKDERSGKGAVNRLEEPAWKSAS